MSCTYDKERLTAFFDGELDAVERADTERHISGCSECLRDLGEIKSAALAVKSLPRPRAPRSIAEGVSREIAGAGRMGRLDVWRRRLFYGVAAAAALLVALNLSYFTTAPALKQVASAPAPEPGLAFAKDKNSAPPQDGKEALAKDLGNSKDQAFNRQSAGQDKGAAEGGARRKLEGEKAVDSLPQAPPGAFPKADAAPARSEAKKELQAGAAPAKPSAPPAPPPAATPRPAEPELAKKAAEAPFADAKLKEAKDSDALRARAGEQTEKARALPLATAYTVGAPAAVDARSKVEALTKKWAAGREAAAAKAPLTSKAPAAEEAPAPKPTAALSSGAAFGQSVALMVVEVTPAQLEELQAELAKAGATIQAGPPEALARGGGGGKDGVADVETRKRAMDPEADRRVDLAGPTVLRKVTIYFVEKK